MAPFPKKALPPPQPTNKHFPHHPHPPPTDTTCHPTNPAAANYRSPDPYLPTNATINPKHHTRTHFPPHTYTPMTHQASAILPHPHPPP
ncbi:hypothetical protein ACTHT4_11455, partial [Neisseria sp. P0022.S007]|uniref:hypothetical protein n=1 Tax=Neisseria sp. P0022.S007 TaxID=3436832 RepID=UPI003F80464C